MQWKSDRGLREPTRSQCETVTSEVVNMVDKE